MKRSVYIRLIFLYYPTMPSTLYRYIGKEVLAAFTLGMVIFTGVLLMGKMLKLADLVVSKGVPLTDILLMIVYLVPSFAIITIPMSLLLAVLLTFSRLSGDSEIIAIKASGISLYGLLPPILVIASAVYALSTLTAVYASPKGHIAFKQLLQKTVHERLNLNVKERVFNSDIPGYLIYVTKNSEQTGALSGVMIQDERNPKNVSTIFAETGSLNMDETSKIIHLTLFDGNIHQPRPDGSYRLLSFKEYDLAIDISKASRDFEKNELEMTIPELRQNLEKGGFSAKLMKDMGLEIHRRFALPFACLIFAIAAVPLGIQNRRSGKAAGFTYSISALLTFYIFQTIGKTLYEKGIFSPFSAVWLPNCIFLAAGIYLFVKAAQEERVEFFDFIARAATKLARKKDKSS